MIFCPYRRVGMNIFLPACDAYGCFLCLPRTSPLPGAFFVIIGNVYWRSEDANQDNLIMNVIVIIYMMRGYGGLSFLYL